MLTLKEKFYLDQETDVLIKTIEEAYPKLSEQGLSAGQPSSTVNKPSVAQNTPKQPHAPPGQSTKTLPVNNQQQQSQNQPLDPRLSKLGAWLLRLSTDEMSKSHVLQLLNNALEKSTQ